ncbi:unnamed protein product [Diamesa serratosioi]
MAFISAEINNKDVSIQDESFTKKLKIHDLNNEDLEMIFGKLDTRSLIKTTEVCSRFNDIISESSKLTSRLKLKVNPSEPFFWKERHLLNSNRKYEKIKVNPFFAFTIYPKNDVENFIFNILKKFGPSIKELEIYQFYFDSHVEVQELMSYFRNIEKCWFLLVHVKDENVGHETCLQFPKLRVLAINKCNFLFNQIFQNCDQLAELHIDSISTPNRLYPSYFENIEDLVFKQKKLKELTLYCNPNNYLFKNDHSKQVMFQLRVLKSYSNCLFLEDEAAVNFFATQHEIS